MWDPIAESPVELFDYDKIRTLALQGPRVTSLLPYFEDIASGRCQVPSQKVLAQPDFLNRGRDYQQCHDIFQSNMGTFCHHLYASIPFLLEQHCRLGVAFQKLAQSEHRDPEHPFTLYETSSADATTGRAWAEYAQGMMKTLADSPNSANAINFRRLCRHNDSYIHLGPFVDITPEYLLSRDDIPYFKHGFDMIYEHTTFQMYGTNRKEQIAYIKRLLKKDGIMFFLEKLTYPDPDEHARREQIKDNLFKAQYFTGAQMEHKALTILKAMRLGQVTLEELTDAIGYHFKYLYMIWNSTNFYEIVASNNESILQRFVSFLGEPYVPAPFACESKMMKAL